MPVMFSDPKKAKSEKLPTTTCSLGGNDRIRSTLEHFHRTFVSKRNFQSSFVLSGTSNRDRRKCFSSLFRHTIHNSQLETNADQAWFMNSNRDMLLPRRVIEPNHHLMYNGVGVKTDEIRLDEHYPHSGDDDIPNEVSKYTPQMVREFVAPYSMQMLETMSWNLNRHKVLPYGLSASQQAQFTFNGHSTFDTFRSGFRMLKAASNYGDSNTVAPTNIQYESNMLTASPVLCDLDYKFEGTSPVVHALRMMNQRYPKPVLDNLDTQLQTDLYDEAQGTEQDPYPSIVDGVRQTNLGIAPVEANPLMTPHNQIGTYHCQLSSGIAYYTFSNTGDSKLIVDMVVHKMKEGMAAMQGENDNLTSRILKHYGEIWMDKRIRKRDQLYVDTFTDPEKQFAPSDIYLNPKVKFMPASCRLPDRETKIELGHRLINRDEIVYPDHNLKGINGFVAGTQHQAAVDMTNPPFVDIFRKQVYIPAGKRKTIAIRFPAKSYDPSRAVYTEGVQDTHSVILNEHGYHILFGVTGEKTRTIIDPTVQQQAAGIGPRVVGQHNAPTSFKVLGRYYETVLPAVCIDPDNNFEQSVSCEMDVLPSFADQSENDGTAGQQRFVDNIEKRIFSATYADATQREVIGRYVRRLIDGQTTRAAQQEAEENEESEYNQMELASGYDDSTTDISNLPDVVDIPEARLLSERSVATEIYRQITTETIQTAYPAPEHCESYEHQGQQFLNAMNKAVTRFITRLPRTISWVRKYISGTEKTVEMLSDVLTHLCAFTTSHPKLCATAQALSGVPPGTIEGFCAAFNAAKTATINKFKNSAELVQLLGNTYSSSQWGAGSAITQSDIDTAVTSLVNNFNPFKLFTGLKQVKHRRLADDGTAITYVDTDDATAGIQPLTSTGGSGGGTINVNMPTEMDVNITEIAGSTVTGSTLPISGAVTTSGTATVTQAGPVTIQDGGNSITVDGGVDVNNTVSVTETNPQAAASTVTIGGVAPGVTVPVSGTVDVPVTYKANLLMSNPNGGTGSGDILSTTEITHIAGAMDAYFTYIMPPLAGTHNDRLVSANAMLDSDGLPGKIRFGVNPGNTVSQWFSQYIVNFPNVTLSKMQVPNTSTLIGQYATGKGELIRGVHFQWVQV